MKRENERILEKVTEITGKLYVPNHYGFEVAIEDLIKLIKQMMESKDEKEKRN